MVRWRDAALVAGAAATGVAAAYAFERAALRRRLELPALLGPPLGSVAGTPVEVRGPDGVRVHVELHGPEDAPAVVLVHGYALSGRAWHHQVVGLGDRLRLVTYDHPGHGRSSAPRSGQYSLDLLADTLEAVVSEVVGERPFVAVGHSLGGMTIFGLGRRHPDLFAERVRGAMLIATTSRTAAERVGLGFGVHLAARLERVAVRAGARLSGRAVRLARYHRASSDLSYLITRTIGFGRHTEPALVDFVEQMVLDTDLDALGGLAPLLLSMDEDVALACLTMPTTIVVGSVDRVTPALHARRMVERCPQADLVELPGVGHSPQLEAPAEVNALILRLVESVLGRPSVGRSAARSRAIR